MSKLFVVFGATGQQGGSAAAYVLNDPVLSKQFRVRAVSRDSASPKLALLKEKGAEVVQADFNDPASVRAAVDGAFVVFGVTLTVYDPVSGAKQETEQGMTLVDAAVDAGVKYFIWSSGTDARVAGRGKYDNLSVLNAKSDVLNYIKSKPITGIDFFPGAFFQNFFSQLRPVSLGDGSYAMFGRFPPTAEIPYIDIRDTGKFVGAMLANPDKFAEKFVAGAEGMYRLPDLVARISAASGKKITYIQASEDQFRQKIPPFLEPFGDQMLAFFLFMSECGYYGPNLADQVHFWNKQAREKLTTIEEFLAERPLEFD